MRKHINNNYLIYAMLVIALALGISGHMRGSYAILLGIGIVLFFSWRDRPYVPPILKPARCPSTKDDHRCHLVVGHSCPHMHYVLDSTEKIWWE